MTAVGLSSSTIQSAGGSTSELEAKVSDSIVLGTSEGLGILTTFYVLDGLTSGANLGEDFLDKTTAFETYRNAFSILNYDDDAAEVNGIIWFNETGSLLSREMDALALKRRLGSGPAQERIPEQEEESALHHFKNRLLHRKKRTDHHNVPATVSKASANLDDLNARELHRREVAQREISDLPEEAREAKITEERERMRTYERDRSRLTLPPPGIGGGSLIMGTFKCDHTGCTALAFQTQYLLNAHADVHSQNRPHYCPVPGCARSEGGRGFKRKNEMIRHGLIHEPPGYIFPFCPEREHKYPRPDNLQSCRHVRVNHMHKDTNDPRLVEVLAQRCEGGSRGRRERLGS